MNWKVRTGLIVAAAVAIYGVVVWSMASPEEPSQSLGKRMAALEQQLDANPNGMGFGARPGSLYATLAANPDALGGLINGWSRERLVAELGWPERVDGSLWGYEARMKTARYLQVQWSAEKRIASAQWLDEAPDPGN